MVALADLALIMDLMLKLFQLETLSGPMDGFSISLVVGS
jgi:hypothetical protein